MLNKDFKEFAELLNSIGVEYLVEPEAVIQLGYPPARIDLLTAIDGVKFEECHPRRVVMKVGGGVDLPIIDVNDFRKNKLASGRAKDLADIESLDEGPSGSDQASGH